MAYESTIATKDKTVVRSTSPRGLPCGTCVKDGETPEVVMVRLWGKGHREVRVAKAHVGETTG